jgi:hypothetical protein
MRLATVVGIAVAVVVAGYFGTRMLEPRVTAPSAPAPTAATAAITNVMVVTDDVLPGGVARGNRVHEDALAAFEQQLRAAGFTVLDGRTIAVVNPALDNEKRSDTEIVQLARRQQPRLDAVVVFSLLTPIEATMTQQNTSIRAAARLFRAADGRSLGSAEWTSPQRWSLPYACDRACLIQTVGVEVPAVASAVGERTIAVLRQGG